MTARPAERDPDTGFWRPAREARAAYDVYDCQVLTDGGGFATLVLRQEALDQAGSDFSLPANGDHIDVPVYVFDQWREGREVRDDGSRKRYPLKAFSFAGSVWASASSRGNRRAVSAAS